MSTDRKPVPNPIVVLREEFDDWAVLFNPDAGNAVGVNPTGVAAWKLLDGEHTLDQIAADVEQQFDNAPDSVGEDVRAFLEQLEEQGFVGYEVEDQA